MKPVAFDYHAPGTLPEALALLAEPGARAVPLAGGQSLVPLLNLRRVRPGTVVDLEELPGLDGVHISAETVRVGAMTRMTALETHTGLREALPVLAEAVAAVAHPEIRHRGTLGGSLCHADPAAELPAVAVALDARLHLCSAGGTRTVPATEFFQGPHTTARRPDELLTEVEFPRRPEFRFVFDEVTRRGEAGFPLVGLCLGVALDGGVVTEARLGAAGVGPRPLRLTAAEARMAGRRLGEDLHDVLAAAGEETDPPADIHGDARYRRALLRTLIRRTVARTATTRSH